MCIYFLGDKMKQISEWWILGNCLVTAFEKWGLTSIKYETAKSISDAVIVRLSKSSNNYQLLPIEVKANIIKQMISKGVFKTDKNNKLVPFKQVYNFEVAKSIYAVYSCDGVLQFMLPKFSSDEKNFVLKTVKDTYCLSVSLDLQSAINAEILRLKPAGKTATPKTL